MSGGCSTTTAPVDVKELPRSYIFVVDVPGLKQTDVKVQVENDTVLKISGERKRESNGGDSSSGKDASVKYVRVERPTGRFMRKFNLPNHVDLDHIVAACQEGVLTIVIPKLPEPEPHHPRSFDIPVTSLGSITGSLVNVESTTTIPSNPPPS